MCRSFTSKLRPSFSLSRQIFAFLLSYTFLCKRIKCVTTDATEFYRGTGSVVPGPARPVRPLRLQPVSLSVRLNTCSLARDQCKRFFATRGGATAVQM